MLQGRRGFAEKKKQQLNMNEALMAELFCSSTPVTFIV